MTPEPIQKSPKNPPPPKPNPFEVPPGKEAVVLVPNDIGEKNRVLELLDEYENVPPVLDALRLNGLKPEHAIFTVISYPTAGNRARQIPRDYKLKIAGPIEVTPQSAASSLDATLSTQASSFQPFLERLAPGLVPYFGMRVTENKILTLVAT